MFIKLLNTISDTFVVLLLVAIVGSIVGGAVLGLLAMSDLMW